MSIRRADDVCSALNDLNYSRPIVGLLAGPLGIGAIVVSSLRSDERARAGGREAAAAAAARANGAAPSQLHAGRFTRVRPQRLARP